MMRHSPVAISFCTTLLFGSLLWAAPGDLQLEVVARTGDAGLGPGGVPLESILTQGGGYQFPVSLDDSGSITFAATTVVDGKLKRGVYKGDGRSSPVLLYREGQNIPGVFQNDERVESTDLRRMASSNDGRFQALRIMGGETYLYRVDSGVIEPAPVTWGEDISQTRNYKDPVTVSDGRGDTRTFGINSIGDRLVISNAGVAYWETGFGGTPTFFRASSKDDIVAIAFEGTEAPGFDPAIEAKLDAPWSLRGIDQFGDAYFVTRIENSGQRFRAVYRHDASDHSLNLLYPEANKPLEGLTASSTVNLEEEDVVVLSDGTVFIRGSINRSNTGFWKREIGGEFAEVILMNEFAGTPVDGENVQFRSAAVDLADWAVAEDHTIYFTADVRNGVAGNNQEGVWRIDPETKLVTTVARAAGDGGGGVAPGTDATYGPIIDISATGEGHVVFTSQLSDGKRGLFAAEGDGAVVKLVIEGDRVAFEDGKLVISDDGSAVTGFYFTPDIAGEDIGRSQGNWGMNDAAEVAFYIELEDRTEALIKASFESVKKPRGDTYVWDGGAGDSDWHTVKEGRSNWLDAAGTPWDKAPPFDGTAVVSIGAGSVVELTDREVYVKSLTNIGSVLKVGKTLSVESTIDLKSAATLELSAPVDGESLSARGAVIKKGDGEIDFRMDRMEFHEADLVIQGGVLDLKTELVTLRSGDIKIERGQLHLEADLRFLGDKCEVKGLAGSEGMVLLATTLRSEELTEFHMESGVSCVFGRPGSSAILDMEFGGTNFLDAGSLKLMGEGSYTFHQPIHIAEVGTLDCLAGRDDSRGGVVFELNEGAMVRAIGTLVNQGSMQMKGGGLSGKFDNFGSFHSTGPLTLLDGDNFGDMVFNADVHYGQLNGRDSNARFRLRNSANLLPADKDLSAFILEGGSQDLFRAKRDIIVETGHSKIVFHSFDSANMGGMIDVRGSASATVEQMNTGLDHVVFRIGKDAELSINGLVFTSFSSNGDGKLILSGEINALDDASSVHMRNRDVEVREAEIFGPINDRFVVLQFQPPSGLFLGPPGDQDVLFDGVTTHAGARLFSGQFSTVTVQGTLTLGDAAYIHGRWELKGDVRDGLPTSSLVSLGGVPPQQPLPPDHPLAGFGGFTIPHRSSIGHLNVCPRLSRGLVFEPPIEFAAPESSITVGEKSELTMTSANLAVDLAGGNLSRGTWIIEDFAALEGPITFASWRIETIGKDATVRLGKPHPSRPSLINLPSPRNDLVIEGNLILKDTVLEMNGNTVYNKRIVDLQGSADIKGDVESIRDEVQGIIKLSGNINIDGNLTTNGVVALGASPGAGIITGDLTLLPGGVMQVEFGGHRPGSEFDFLEVGGKANLAGQLTLSLLDEFQPETDDAFLFLTASEVAGEFDEIEQDTLGRQRRFTVTRDALGLTATMSALSITSYADWREAFFSASEAADDAISGLLADPDSDGVVNLAEYLAGTLPESPSAFPLTQVSDHPNRFSLQVADGVADYSWALDASTDLVDWQPVTVRVLGEAVDTMTTTLEIEVQEAVSSPRRFYRLAIIP